MNLISLIESSAAFGVVVSIIGYEIGSVLKRKFKYAVLNPLLISIVFVICLLSVLNMKYDSYYESAKYLSYLLTPATVCLAVPLYKQLTLLKKNLVAILVGITSGVLANLICIFLLSLLFKLNHKEYVTLLPKSITTAIGMGVSEEFGGYAAITVAAIIFTGIFGNIAAVGICKVVKVIDPIAKGVAIGTASHAIGTVKAMELGEVEGAMSSLSIVVCGIITLVGVSVFVGLI